MNIEVLETPYCLASVMRDTSSVLELRQYSLHPGRRDELIALFEREFIEPQQALGMCLPGLFRDLDRADRFVWLRGFANLAQRADALARFYGGPVWKANRDAANATMIDSDNVLLLRPARPAFGFMLPPQPPPRSEDTDPGVVFATIHYLRANDAARFVEFFERVWLPLLWNASVPVAASFVTESGPNSFPALPVREDESVFVWFSCHPSLQRATQAQARIQEALDWSPTIANEMAPYLARPGEVLRLAPTARSRLRG